MASGTMVYLHYAFGQHQATPTTLGYPAPIVDMAERDRRQQLRSRMPGARLLL